MIMSRHFYKTKVGLIRCMGFSRLLTAFWSTGRHSFLYFLSKLLSKIVIKKKFVLCFMTDCNYIVFSLGDKVVGVILRIQSFKLPGKSSNNIKINQLKSSIHFNLYYTIDGSRPVHYPGRHPMWSLWGQHCTESLWLL